MLPTSETALLHGLRVLDVSLLGAGILAQQLADLGADVVKVEPSQGDHVRASGGPIIEGVSLLHWHWNRGKRSIVLDLNETGDVDTFLRLVARTDILIEGMRPGGLERRGLNWERLVAANPQLVMCSISGFGPVGPLARLAMHGMGFDAWAATLTPEQDGEGNPIFPNENVAIGSCVGPLWGALGVLAGVLRARATGQPCRMDVSQAGAAAVANPLPLEALKRAMPAGTPRPQADPENPLRASVRYNFYRTSNGTILVMMTEKKFWKSFCESVGRPELFEQWPGKLDPDHDFGNEALRTELRQIFVMQTSEWWIRKGLEADFPIIQVHSKTSLLADEHFAASMQWIPGDEHPLEMLGIPIRIHGAAVPHLRRAPTIGEHNREVRADWLIEISQPPSGKNDDGRN